MGLPYIQNNLFFIQNITPEVDLAKQSSEEINQSKVTAASVEGASQIPCPERANLERLCV